MNVVAEQMKCDYLRAHHRILNRDKCHQGSALNHRERDVHEFITKHTPGVACNIPTSMFAEVEKNQRT